ncbi:RNA polymerase sigma-70 factor [Bailinhaonella thermotolerans]|uniref:RNA polymerase sigma-70 factor n=1 Tax=Bailinhaonella thermotolerans TaxID=1070861 RepID=A0A3A4B4F7_9ACTN|nr:RNA polymerase sigma-70 factor [Bailinhaonella thermotolerans]RJL33197.1 RNA polymerase sigma-70 factor [Bailinhaonella thermotolerans]
MADLDEFEAHREHLWAVAYRILGTVGDAEDAVQETWLRWERADRDAVDNARAFLTTTVSRVCYDLLGSARARRETYVGEWLPEPIVSAEPTPEERAELDESVEVALLAMMERLTPAERTSLVLHDVFSLPFEQVAEVVGRSPEAVRGLASRARRRVREHGPRRTVDVATRRKAVEAFVGAATRGDLPGLVAVLDPDVVWRADGGGVVRAARQPIEGADRVSRMVLGLVTKWYLPGGMSIRSCAVNGWPGIVVLDASGAVSVVFAFAVDDEGRITEVDLVLNPEKLTHVSL